MSNTCAILCLLVMTFNNLKQLRLLVQNYDVACIGFLQLVQTCDNPWWFFMTFDNFCQLLKTFDDFWWLLTLCDDSWWLVTTFDPLWRHTMNYDNLQLLVTTCDNFWRLVIACDDLWQLVMTSDNCDNLWQYVNWKDLQDIERTAKSRNVSQGLRQTEDRQTEWLTRSLLERHAPLKIQRKFQ